MTSPTLREALADLLSWFEGGPSCYGPWIIKAGKDGADDAIEAARAALAAPGEPVARPDVTIQSMKLSDGRTDYYVSIRVCGREVTPHVYREEYKAAYHVALYNWLLNGGEKPDLMAFNPDDFPAQPVASPRALDVEEVARTETAPAGDAAKLADRIERAVMVNGQIGPNLNRNERDLIVALLRAAPQWRTEQVEALARAMWQLLDDMGSGHAVCDQAKQEAISALEPFRASVQGGEC